jgi:RNA polymerase sigma-70 factor (ECF subfamily)
MTLPLSPRAQTVRSARRSPAEQSRVDERMFEVLFREHYAALCQFVDSYVRAPDVAEEIVQGVFLRLWESRESWDPKRGPRAYLFAACRNQALDVVRHEKIVARTAELACDVSVGQGTVPARADAEVENAELGDRLRAMVAQLPERRRMVVVLRWQHQLTNPEIARVMGISVKGVEMQFSRALADLRRHLGNRLLDLV